MACACDKTCQALIQAINSELTIEIKDLGQLTRYNGVDVEQGRDFIKLGNVTYIDKMLEEHDWMLKDEHIANQPIPMNCDKAYSRLLETVKGPETVKEQRQLQNDMGFNY